MRTVTLAIVGLAALSPASLWGQIQGIVLVPFKTDSATYGEVGQLVRFSEADYRITLELPSGRVEVRPSEGSVVPLDPQFTPSYVLSALRACAPGCRAPDARRGDTQDEVAQRLLVLVERVIELFPDYADIAEFHALRCDFLRPLDTKGEDLTQAIECAERFVLDHPDHPRADAMEYGAVSMRNSVYEFEGDVSAMKEQADTLEAFASEHPDSDVLGEILSRVARLYYMMYESSPPGMERDQYRARALELYDRLATSPEASIRLNAVILRFNLEHGRAIYINPNAWTRAF